MSFNEFFILGLSYLIGSIPFGIIVTKYAKIGDITKQGSGNIGATNVARVAGKKLGAMVLALDMLKGMLAVIIAKHIMVFDPETECYAAIAVVIGHIFPIWLKFKGGKGVATGLGTAFILVPLAALFALVIWAFTFKITKISAVAALVSVSLLPIMVYFFGETATKFHMQYAIIVSLLIFIKHKENIIRLLNGNENKFK